MNMQNFLKGVKNPREFVFNYLSTNSNPINKNLLEMTKNGDSKGIENFARNIFKEQGRDFDKEFSDFMNNFK